MSSSRSSQECCSRCTQVRGSVRLRGAGEGEIERAWQGRRAVRGIEPRACGVKGLDSEHELLKSDCILLAKGNLSRNEG